MANRDPGDSCRLMRRVYPCSQAWHSNRAGFSLVLVCLMEDINNDLTPKTRAVQILFGLQRTSITQQAILLNTMPKPHFQRSLL